MTKKILLTLLTGTTLLSAGGDVYHPADRSLCGLYTDEYMMSSGIVHPCIDTGIPNTLSANTLMKKKAIFHVTVHFSEGVMLESSKEKLQALLTKAQLPYFVSVIGHSAYNVDKDHSIKLSPWAEFWQNLGHDQMTSTAMVNDRIQTVYSYLQKNHVSTVNIYNENRMDFDPVSTEATSTGRALNNRVDVTLYY